MSLVVDSMGLNVDMPCASCENAIWKLYKADGKRDNQDVLTLKRMQSPDGTTIYGISCWCSLQHQFVETQPILCDGNPSHNISLKQSIPTTNRQKPALSDYATTEVDEPNTPTEPTFGNVMLQTSDNDE